MRYRKAIYYYYYYDASLSNLPLSTSSSETLLKRPTSDYDEKFINSHDLSDTQTETLLKRPISDTSFEGRLTSLDDSQTIIKKE